MQTLHLRADSDIIDKILEMINQFSLRGDKIEILDNLLFNTEKRMILKSLVQEEKKETVEHDKLWDELLQ